VKGHGWTRQVIGRTADGEVILRCPGFAGAAHDTELAAEIAALRKEMERPMPPLLDYAEIRRISAELAAVIGTITWKGKKPRDPDAE